MTYEQFASDIPPVRTWTFSPYAPVPEHGRSNDPGGAASASMYCKPLGSGSPSNGQPKASRTRPAWKSVFGERVLHRVRERHLKRV